MNNNLQPQSSEFLLYTTPDGKVHIDVFFKDETVWLTQKKMAELFDIDRSVITKHLKNIFESGELSEKSVSARIAHTASDGKIYKTTFYNLDVIISVGYRVNSSQATRFRIWATQTLRQYIIKGFALDDERLISSYFDYLEHLVENHTTFKMEDLAESLNKFLEFNEYKVLGDAGRISKSASAMRDKHWQNLTITLPVLPICC